MSVVLPNENSQSPEPVLDSLDEGQLGGSNVKSVNIGGQAGVGLLGAVRAVNNRLATDTTL